MMWGYHTSSAWWVWPVIAAAAAAGAGLITLALIILRRSGPDQASPAEQILGQRLARGDINEAEYARRHAVLRAGLPARHRGLWWRRAPAAVIAAAVMAAVSLAAAAATATHAAPAGFGRSSAARSCAAPALPGHTVDVTLWDMGAMMGGRYPAGMMGGRYSSPSNGPTGRSGWMRMMRVTATPAAVPAGDVSFRVRNTGSLTHELVILPPPAAGPGSRPVAAGGTVSERGSLGEASATCAAGAGQGITPAATGWVTLHLAPGRYELICNLPGHYAMGMFTQLDVQQ